MTRRLFVAAIIISSLAACSGGSATAPPTIITPPVATTFVATDALPTTAQATTAAATTVASTPPTTQTTIVAARTTVSAEPLETTLQRLLDRYDAAVASILADPRVAGDPSNPRAAAYLALFPKDSAFAGGGLKAWADEGAKGRFYRAGPAGAILKSALQKITASTSK